MPIVGVTPNSGIPATILAHYLRENGKHCLQVRSQLDSVLADAAERRETGAAGRDVAQFERST